MRKSGLLLLVTFICSCGGTSSGPSAIDPSVAPTPTALPTTAPHNAATSALPATTVLVKPIGNDALLGSIEPARVTEPCPDSPGGPDGTAAMQTELTRLEPMLGVVLAYGGQHPDEFGSYGLVWHGVNDASVFISFTTNLPRHRDALSAVVAHPDELIVCQVAVSGDVARALIAVLTDDLTGRFETVAIGRGGVEVVLRAGEHALADELRAQYGDAVSVTVDRRAAAASTVVPL